MTAMPSLPFSSSILMPETMKVSLQMISEGEYFMISSYMAFRLSVSVT